MASVVFPSAGTLEVTETPWAPFPDPPAALPSENRPNSLGIPFASLQNQLMRMELALALQQWNGSDAGDAKGIGYVSLGAQRPVELIEQNRQ